mmetsp:Transcript_7925/g.20990  ORF Transcript_7925/g.20990 Transcript_7925/m.20990 type:complete len:208 (-) Transcript_7925:458-1081(-)
MLRKMSRYVQLPQLVAEQHLHHVHRTLPGLIQRALSIECTPMKREAQLEHAAAPRKLRRRIRRARQQLVAQHARVGAREHLAHMRQKRHVLHNYHLARLEQCAPALVAAFAAAFAVAFAVERRGEQRKETCAAVGELFLAQRCKRTGIVRFLGIAALSAREVLARKFCFERQHFARLALTQRASGKRARVHHVAHECVVQVDALCVV